MSNATTNLRERTVLTAQEAARELDQFKTSIDLRAYAATQGYTLDRKESWRGSSVMRHANGDKIIVKRDADGHHVYFSVRDEKDNGTIIDFVRRRRLWSLGAVRKELQLWVSTPSSALVPYPALVKTCKNRIRVENTYAQMREASRHPYLENQRAIPAALLDHPRFADRVRINQRGDAIFPHFDDEGLCGFEMKNSGMTRFAAGGTKGLWTSNIGLDDRRLVVCESAIDALSYAALYGLDDSARYASISGRPSPQQPELIRAAVACLPAASEVVSAMDADSDGRKLASIVGREFELSGRHDLTFRIHEPSGFKDWNDQLRAMPKQSFPPSPRNESRMHSTEQAISES